MDWGKVAKYGAILVVLVIIVVALLATAGYLPRKGPTEQSTCTNPHAVSTVTTTITTVITHTSNGVVIVQPTVLTSVIVYNSC
jgi:flagellar basal body-associated protein FliL